MKRSKALLAALLVAAAGLAAQAVAAQAVKITPLGSHDGEFCALDRALIFEDPDGTRILYDPGMTVRGADDPRLGRIDAVLLSHVHADHLGAAHQAEANAGACGKPAFTVKDTPTSNSVNIVVAKKARFIVGGEMPTLFQAKVEAAGGDPKQVQLLRFGAHTTVGKVGIASVPAVHTNGLSPAFLEGELAETMAANGLTAYVGPPNGYVLQFSNGLVAYLSGDTGITAEQEMIRRYYEPNLAVMNIGDVYTTGPKAAAYVVNELVQPRSVIASHANEPATKDGKLRPGTKTAAFRKATRMPVYVPLSGRTMEFDGHGKCVAGCRAGKQ